MNKFTKRLLSGGPGSGRYPKGSHQNIGDLLEHKIARNWSGAVKAYNAVPTTGGGRILNTDDARELSKGYRDDRTRSAEVHEPASQFIKDLYKDKLSRPTPQGLVPTVLFTAGGTGAGKSVSLRAADPQDLASKAEIVYDTNMNNVPSATSKIDQALAAGRNVRVAYTYRDPVEAMTGGALPRAMRMGRTVPLAEHIKTHVGAYATVSALQEHYANNPNVEFRLFDNSRGPGKAARVLTVDDLPKMDDNGLEGRLHVALNQARTSGRISEAVYQGTLGKGLGTAVGKQSESERVRGAGSGTAQAPIHVKRLLTGGPGSGRYPKGSGDHTTVSSLKLIAGHTYNGKSIQLNNKLSKSDTGKLGEAIATAYMKSQGVPDTHSLNTSINNFPVDLIGDHQVAEIKAGLVSNGPSAQQWRATIGQPAATEAAWLKSASSDEKAAWNQSKADAILKRKNQVVADYSKKLGQTVKGRTITTIINPDKKTVDVFAFDGFHSRIAWNSPQAKAAYKGTYAYS